MTAFPLVSPQWLQGMMKDPSVVVLDASYHLPTVDRDAFAEYEAARIPGARFFDVDGIKDPDNPLPHMVPSPDLFAEAVSKLGITNDSHVVCYDCYGLFSAARPWWMFRLYGHDRVSVLDGGLPAWKAAGLPLETGKPAPVPSSSFKADFRPELLKTVDEMKAIVAEGGYQIVDARPAGRFDGSVPEPRPEVRGGRMPGSFNTPSADFSDPETGRVKDVASLEAMFREAGVRIGGDPIVTSCGSGVTACILALGLHLIGVDQVAVYDGSWSEWGTRPDTPIENPAQDS